MFWPLAGARFVTQHSHSFAVPVFGLGRERHDDSVRSSSCCYFCLGWPSGFIMELVLESLVLRIFVIVIAALGLWALNNDVGLTRPIPEDNTTSLTEIKKEEMELQWSLYPSSSLHCFSAEARMRTPMVLLVA